MKMSFILVFPILFISFFAVNLAGAQTSNCPSNEICIENPVEAETFEELINAIIDFLWMFGIAVVPMVIIIAGYFFVTSAGDPAKVTQAKNMILYALIGLLIIGMAKGIVTLIQEVFK
jgi:beta-lactamase regulating signal transducer with metallopeptidase domain